MTYKQQVQAIREMEKYFALPCENLKEVDFDQYYEWLMAGFETLNEA